MLIEKIKNNARKNKPPSGLVAVYLRETWWHSLKARRPSFCHFSTARYCVKTCQIPSLHRHVCVFFCTRWSVSRLGFRCGFSSLLLFCLDSLGVPSAGVWRPTEAHQMWHRDYWMFCSVCGAHATDARIRNGLSPVSVSLLKSVGHESARNEIVRFLFFYLVSHISMSA